MFYPLHDRLIQPSIRLAAEMSYRGIRVDVAKINQTIDESREKLKEAAEIIYNEIGTRFNIGSSKQILDIVYPKLGITEEHVSLTRGGKPSTDKKALKKLSKDFPFIEKITEYRHLEHDINNYLLTCLNRRDANDIIHPNWNATGTETGRWTCKDPAMQTFPKPMKAIIIPREGNIFIEADYSQAEMRILAWYSQDPVLLKAVEDGIDLHSTNASAFFGKDLETFLREYKAENPEYVQLRANAKNLGFLLVYRGREGAIMRLIGVSYEEARKIREDYLKTLTKVMPWSDGVIRFIKKNKYIRSAYGRIRHYTSVDFESMKTEISQWGKSYQVYADRDALNAEKEAPNFLIQGTSVDFVNKSILKASAELTKLGGFVVAEVHDSGLFEVPAKHQQEAIDILQEFMTRPIPPIDIKMDIDIGVGDNYRDIK